jgi:hypothetical protein
VTRATRRSSPPARPSTARAERALDTASDAYGLVDPRADVQMDDSGTTVQAGAAGTTVTVSTG